MSGKSVVVRIRELGIRFDPVVGGYVVFGSVEAL